MASYKVVLLTLWNAAVRAQLQPSFRIFVRASSTWAGVNARRRPQCTTAALAAAIPATMRS